MPVLSTRRYSSSSYLPPSSSTSSSVGSYRSNYSSSSSTNPSSTKDLPSSTSRYNFGDSSYRSYRSSYTSGISSGSGTTGSYRSRYDYDDKGSSTGSSLSTRIGIRSVALRNALPTTTTTRTWDRDYSSTGSSLYSSRNSLGDSKSSNDRSEMRNGSSYVGGYRASNISPSKSPARDSIYDRKTTALVEGQCGLWNIGNTCFMNSVLQCLSHTNDLSKFARSASALTATVDKGSASSAKDQKIWAEFCKLIKQMWQTGAKNVNPSEMKIALSAKHRVYSGSAQQDAQEFLRYLLDALHGGLNIGGQKISLKVNDEMSDLEKANVMWDWYTKRENSVIKDLFVGQLKSSLHCTYCEKTSVMYDPFWDLSVPVPSTPNCKLDKCLELFTVKDVLDGVESPYCDYCKTTRKCIKGFTIQRFPKYLVIHLKRFSEMRWTKLTNIVEFPTGIAELDLTPYAADSMEKGDIKPIYSLYGISNHMGSTHGGHYVGVCKHPVTKKWFEFNDNFVSETRESSLVSSSAYLLFYERV